MARIKGRWILRHKATNGAGRRQPQIGVDIHFAHTVLDALDNLLHRHTVGLRYVAAEFIDNCQPLLGHRAGAVHHQMGIRDAGVDRFDAIDGENITGGRAREFVGAVTGADGYGQGIDLGGLDEIGGFFGVGKQLRVLQHPLGADAVFFTGFSGFQRTQATELTLNRHTTGVGHRYRAPGYIDVVLIARRGFAVLQQRAIHHHRAETHLDRALAHRRAGAVILVHTHRNMGKFLYCRQDQMAQEIGAGIFAGARRSLHDDRTIGLVCRFHNGAHLLEIVDVISRHAISVVGSVI